VSEIFQSEIIISEISNLLRIDRHVAIGAASPIPGSAALLAEEERKNSDSKLKVTILHSQKFNNFTDGSRELFDASAQGRIDTFFFRWSSNRW
jgi:glutaconate CoA-transferase subunit B